MTIKLKFLMENNELKECIPDKIRLTSSLNQETGTILLNFSRIFSLEDLINQTKPIQALYLIDEKLSISTKNIRCIWRKGTPILIQAIFLIHNKENLSLILKIFREYAKINGLIDYKLD